MPTDPGDHGRKNAEMDILGYSRSELSILRQRYVPFPVFVHVQYFDAYQYIVNGPKVTNVPHIRTSYASGDILMCGVEEASMLLRCYVRSYPSLYCTADRRHGPVRFPLMSEEMNDVSGMASSQDRQRTSDMEDRGQSRCRKEECAAHLPCVWHALEYIHAYGNRRDFCLSVPMEASGRYGNPASQAVRPCMP